MRARSTGGYDWTDPDYDLEDAQLDALRDINDPEDSRCIDCSGDLEDGNYTLICRECADVDE